MRDRDMPGVIQTLNGIPIPSDWQTTRFAEFFIQAHSWYKKLPILPPGEQVVFYLSPAAGMYWEPSQGQYLEVTESNRMTPGAYTTEQWREYFGHWAYSMRVDRRETVMIQADQYGTRTALPQPLVAECSCDVTAFIHPRASEVTRLITRRARVAKVLESYDDQHSDFSRYHELLRNVGEDDSSRLGSDTPSFEEQHIHNLVHWFALAEHRVLANRIRDTLRRARTIWRILKSLA